MASARQLEFVPQDGEKRLGDEELTGAECQPINFAPLVMADGLAPSNHPILMFRSPANAVSFAKRLGGQQPFSKTWLCNFCHKNKALSAQLSLSREGF